MLASSTPAAGNGQQLPGGIAVRLKSDTGTAAAAALQPPTMPGLAGDESKGGPYRDLTGSIADLDITAHQSALAAGMTASVLFPTAIPSDSRQKEICSLTGNGNIHVFGISIFLVGDPRLRAEPGAIQQEQKQSYYEQGGGAGILDWILFHGSIFLIFLNVFFPLSNDTKLPACEQQIFHYCLDFLDYRFLERRMLRHWAESRAGASLRAYSYFFGREPEKCACS
jgi:hypothetical protein